jgi:hypothetical protein
MAGHDYSAVSTHLVRTELWSDQMKDVLYDVLQGQQYVNWMTNFPDGVTFTIPSIGELPMRNVDEANPAVYDAMDTGEFQFTINKYVESATYITDKAKQDAYYAEQLIAAFVPKMKRAIEENLETNIFALADSQTAANPNTINGGAHRFVAHGASNTVLSLEDFAQAKFAMDKANVSQRRVAVIDPSQEFVLNTLTNLSLKGLFKKALSTPPLVCASVRTSTALTCMFPTTCRLLLRLRLSMPTLAALSLRHLALCPTSL